MGNNRNETKFQYKLSLKSYEEKISLNQILYDIQDYVHYGVLFVEWRRNFFGDRGIKFFLDEIENHLLYSFTTDYCYASNRGRRDAFVFKMNNDMLQILINMSENNLFFYDEHGLETSPLRDLCLFRSDETLLLGTYSHEKIADLYLTEEEESNLWIEYDMEKRELRGKELTLSNFHIPMKLDIG